MATAPLLLLHPLRPHQQDPAPSFRPAWPELERKVDVGGSDDAKVTQKLGRGKEATVRKANKLQKEQRKVGRKVLDKNMEFISPTVVIILGCVALLLFLQWKNLRGPPCIGGWIPWIGAGFEFGKTPLQFIEKARIKYGPIFTIVAVGTRMTFVTEEEGINVFLKSKEVNFELAVQTPVYRTASIPKNIFLKLHEKLYIMVKGKMGTFNLYQFTGQLTEELHEQLENLGPHGTMDLNNLVRHLLYPVTVNVLFKKGLFPTNERKIREFHQHFQAYDEGFEYGSQLPECLLRNWSKSKKWLLALFEKNIPDIKTCKSAKDNSPTVMQALLDLLEMETNEQKSPNYGLLLLWASLSNAVPVAFWTFAFVLSHPNIHRAIMEAISSVFGTAGTKTELNCIIEEISNNVYLSHIMGKVKCP
ncbi:hypothetical protein J1605_012067 [Eschrichtius robustus]|uniref:24-hydroxycholesterol 7-alpha-hydroxylase n=1 Tax=Eschrichtius robustus TaxID=9764 RepID=A0AB34GKB4_ESCRO|nr:hypothetical protein J1605_012067 [Eschrichtius robustus]